MYDILVLSLDVYSPLVSNGPGLLPMALSHGTFQIWNLNLEPCHLSPLTGAVALQPVSGPLKDCTPAAPCTLSFPQSLDIAMCI